MSDSCNILPPQQQRGLDLLIAGCSIPEAAKQLGCRRETVWRWTQNPAFAAQLTSFRQARSGDIAQALEEGAVEAVHTLREVMGDAHQGGLVRVRAAEKLLDRSGFGKEQTWKVEAHAKTETVVETVRVQQARETGDPNKVLLAMQEDAEELRVILGALVATEGAP